MNNISRCIFKAIHEGKWLSIEYVNKQGDHTKYWIGIRNLNVGYESLSVVGMHIMQHELRDMTIYISGIVAASVIDGTYFERNQDLIDDINEFPEKYALVFKNVVNLSILNYLSDCNRMDNVPYKSNYSLVDKIDGDILSNDTYHLTEVQFSQIVSNYQRKATGEYKGKEIKEIALNMLSINTKDGIYPLAYKPMALNVIKRTLEVVGDTQICYEFSIDGRTQSVRKFLDADDYHLLNDFDKNKEIIKDIIMQTNSDKVCVDDLPYIMTIDRHPIIDLDEEYSAVTDMYASGNVPVPIRAFFGELVAPSRKKKNWPIAFVNTKVNLDQLLAIHNANKYEITYVQGPPGTGKTNTIVNTIMTAFFNERTVLFASYNNHPVDSVFKTMIELKYKGQTIPFPILRLGNDEKVLAAAEYIKKLVSAVKNITIYEGTLGKKKIERTEQTKKLTDLLERYEESLELYQTEDAVRQLAKRNNNMTFQVDLQDRQLSRIQKRLHELGTVTNQEALSVIDFDEDNFYQYLHYTSAMYIKRLLEPKYKDLLIICENGDEEERLVALNQYFKNEDNIKKLQRVFPIILTSCISAHKLGAPKPMFDITIIDEASQCNTAVSLIPILRGENLMLVGDPQQLNPVVVLDNSINDVLRKKYNIIDEYDYINNSIYKCFLACDSVSDEILLSHHYRCAKEIIEFNNKKYYNGKLQVDTTHISEKPLVFIEVPNDTTNYKNTAPSEVSVIMDYVKKYKGKSIGIITPFANQKTLFEEELKSAAIADVPCGTVHAFQGDEKDIIFFSLGLTDKTYKGTYEWLKNNKELINVAVSRAKNQFVIVGSKEAVERLHGGNAVQDDLYELVQYVMTNGESKVTTNTFASRALGIKPYSTETETAFMTSLTHALGNVLLTTNKYSVKKEVPISQVFSKNEDYKHLFYTGRFDFVIYEKDISGEWPILAIELDGKEHKDEQAVVDRDKQKNDICRKHGFELIRVENSYARRYNYIKDILIQFFESNKK